MQILTLNHKNIELPKRTWSRVSIVGICHFMSDFYTNILPVMLPILALRFDISYAQCAALFMVFSVTMNFAQPIIGVISDKKNFNYLMPISILTSTVFACLISLAPNITTLVLICFMVGLCSSLFHPIGASVLNMVAPLSRPSLATALYIVGGNIGFALAPFIVAKYIDLFSDKYLIFIALPAFITVFFVYRYSMHASPVKTKDEVLNISFKKIFKDKDFVFLNLAMGLRSWSYCSIVVFITLLLTSKGYSSVHAASSLMIALLGCVAGGLIGGSSADKFGPRVIILLSLVLATISFAFYLLNPSMSLMSLFLLFLTGLGAYASTAPAIVWLQSMLKNAAAFATSLMLGLSFGFGYVATLITGFVADFIGLQSALLVTTIPALILAIVLMLFVKRKSI